MKKYKLKLTPDLSVALISAIDSKLSQDADFHYEKLMMAGLVELKEKLVSRSFMQQGEYKVSLSHVQALSLLTMTYSEPSLPVDTQFGNYLLQTSNAIAQKYSV